MLEVCEDGIADVLVYLLWDATFYIQVVDLFVVVLDLVPGWRSARMGNVVELVKWHVLLLDI